jgi:hypothetical protein
MSHHLLCGSVASKKATITTFVTFFFVFENEKMAAMSRHFVL